MARALPPLIWAMAVGFFLYFSAKGFAAEHPKDTFVIGWLAGGLAGAICAMLPSRR